MKAGKEKFIHKVLSHPPIFSAFFCCGFIFFSFSVAFAQSVLSFESFYKLGVAENGVYKIDHSFLRTLGLNPEKINPNTLKIYGNGGKMLPQANSAFRYQGLQENTVFVHNGQDSVFGENDYLLFYAQGPDNAYYDEQADFFKVIKNIYADTNYYFLAISEERGKRITTRASLPTWWGTVVNSYDDFYHHEIDETNIVGSGRQWYGERFTEEHSVYQFSIPEKNLISDAPVKVAASVISTSVNPSEFIFTFNGQHEKIIKVNAAHASVYGYKAREGNDTWEVESSFVTDSADLSLKITYQSSSGHAGYLDDFTLNTKKKLAYSGKAFHFRSLESTGQFISEFRILEAPDDLMVWDITEPTNVISQDFQYHNGKISFKTYTDSLREFIAFKEKDLLRPVFVEKVPNQNLQALSPPELLIVSHGKFLNEAQRLANFRIQYDKLTVAVVTPKQIYNEFSSGKQDVTAIRDFIRFLYKNSGKLKYVLLFGDASYDYKNRATQNTNFVPTYQSFHSLHNIHSYASDDFFGFMDDGEGEWPENAGTDNLTHDLDLGIGRLPVKSIEEAKIVVDKLIRYATQPEGLGNWRSKITFIADDGDQNKHQLQSDFLADRVEEAYPEYNVNRIFLDAFPQEKGKGSPVVRKKIEQVMERGSLVVDFIGHGGETAWTNENILNVSTINAWENEYKMPVFMTATCEFGRFDDPHRNSGAELALLHPKGGAIALFTTTRPVFPNTTFEVSQAFYRELFATENGKKPRLGDIFRKTKNAGIAGTTNRNFTLLGDPSMQLAYPEKEIVVTSINDQGPNTSMVAPLEKVTMQGEVQYNDRLDATFTGEASITVLDKATQISTLGDEGAETVMTYENRQNVLFRGKTVVENGRFQCSFPIPKSVSREIGEAKISVYARHDTRQGDALGTSPIKVGGNPVASSDNKPPDIQLFLNNSAFRSEQSVLPEATLIASLSDASGINITETEAHGIVAILEGEETYEEWNLNAYYSALPNQYDAGELRFPLKKLQPGKYLLTLLASDIHHNRAKEEISFTIVDENTPMIEAFQAYPNPSASVFTFKVSARNFESEVMMTLEIFTATGEKLQRYVQTVESQGYFEHQLRWDAKDQYGNGLPIGLYLYQLTVQSESQKIRKSGRLILVN